MASNTHLLRCGIEGRCTLAKETTRNQGEYTIQYVRLMYISVFHLCFSIAVSQTTLLHMKRLNKTEPPIFVLMCILRFQSQHFRILFFKPFVLIL